MKLRSFDNNFTYIEDQMWLKYLQKTITVSARLRHAYTNWFEIILSYLFYRRPPKQILLRNGARIDSSSETSIVLVHQLARLIENGWEVVDSSENYLLLRSNFGIYMKCRKHIGNDVAQLSAICIDKIYGQNFKDKVILDVGMYIGDSSIYFARKGAKIVIGLEPYSESYELAIENIRLNGLDEEIKPLKVGLSSEKGKARLKISSTGVEANTLVPMAFLQSQIEFSKETEVDTISLEELMRMFHLERIDLLKMNCEGCEYDVLRNLSNDMIIRVEEVILGFHNGIQDLKEILKGNGFQITRIATLSNSGIAGFLYAKKIPPFENAYSDEVSSLVRHS